jgi:hypothetical protein
MFGGCREDFGAFSAALKYALAGAATDIKAMYAFRQDEICQSRNAFWRNGPIRPHWR